MRYALDRIKLFVYVQGKYKWGDVAESNTLIHWEITPAPCGLPSKLDLVWVEPGLALGSRPYAHQWKAVSQL